MQNFLSLLSKSKMCIISLREREVWYVKNKREHFIYDMSTPTFVTVESKRIIVKMVGDTTPFTQDQ